MKEKIIEKIKTMLPLLNKKQKRLYLAAEAIAYGRGGILQTLLTSHKNCLLLIMKAIFSIAIFPIEEVGIGCSISLL